MINFRCEFCGQLKKNLHGLIIHIIKTKSHPPINIYYDKYIKVDENDGICNYRNCNNKTKFGNLTAGYLKFCCNDHANKEHGLDEECRYRNSQRQKISQNLPHVKDRSRETARLQWLNEETRRKYSDTCKKIWTPQKRNEVSIFHKTLWANDEYRSMQMKLIHDRWSNNEFRNNFIKCHNTISAKENHSNASKQRWLNVEYRQKILNFLRTPQYRKYMSDLVTQKILNGQWHPNHGNYNYGHFESQKCNNKMFYRSSYELAALELLELDDSVEQFITEPFRIQYQDKNDNLKFYIPDILIEYKDGIKKLIEIKPEIFLTDDNIIRKIFALHQYANTHNLLSQIWSEKDLGIIK